MVDGHKDSVREDTLTEFLLARIAEDEVEESTMADLRQAFAPLSRARTHDGEAKRRIVESFCGNLHERWDDGVEAEKVGRDVLGHLALPYADHPDYRDEWKP